MDHNMDDLYNIFAANDLWGNGQPAKTDDFETIEFRQVPGKHEAKAYSRKVSATECEKWLDEGSQLASDDHTGVVLARFVWVDINLGNQDAINLNISDHTRERILKAFGLKTAYRYSKSSVSGVSALPRTTTPQGQHQAFVLCHAPKIAAIWSHSRFHPPMARNEIVQGIVLAVNPVRKPTTPKSPWKRPDSEQPRRIPIPEQLKKMPWMPFLCENPTFPAYLFSILLSQQIDDAQRAAQVWVKEVESKTAYHDFEHRQNRGLGSELGVLEAKTSGKATKMASCERKSKMVSKLLDFTENISEDQCSTRGHFREQPSPICDCSKMKARVGLIRERLEMQRIDTEYTLERIRIQIAALFHIVAQKDSESNLKIARLTRRDSSSMKTLAIVTMVFLPGSFVSALFSTNSFDWDAVDKTRWGSIGVGITPQFWLFWVVTVLLTAAVFGCYFLWLWYLKIGQRPDTVAGSTESVDESMIEPPSTDDEAERQDIVPQDRASRFRALSARISKTY